MTQIILKWFRNYNVKKHSCFCGSASIRNFSDVQKSEANGPRELVLGIETSCDDTGVAVVDKSGKILGEALYSQESIHRKFGGITPFRARDLHAENISRICDLAVNRSGVKLDDLSAIAATVKPGLTMSLKVGLTFTDELLQKCGKPFIPIHHMEAHALTVRMIEKIEFPFLVLLVSGGHCLLAVVRSVSEFLLLGSALDNAPGEAFDKVARRMKFINIAECSGMNGGSAIEYLATKGDPLSFEFPHSMWKHRDCQFSFSGIMFKAFKYIQMEEQAHGVVGDGIIPRVNDLCASFQYAMSRHILQRVSRGIAYCDLMKLIPDDKRHRYLVVSGGVACNKYIRATMELLCQQTDYQLLCPPPKLCTDNGVMIAWNGMERLTANVGILRDAKSVSAQGKAEFGTSLIHHLTTLGIKPPRIPLDPKKIEEIIQKL